jgi:uncharacterized protein (UPF0147 family)
MADEMKKHVEELIAKAARDEKPDAAMKYAQAALNAANAISILHHISNPRL